MSKYLDRAKEVRAIKEVHYNCTQGVLVAFADALGVDEDILFRTGANFGKGMRTGSVCGAVTGALMALGLAGIDDAETVAKLFRAVRDKHEGCVDCKDLLRMNAGTGIPNSVHCDGMVFELVELTEQILRERGKIE